MTERFLGFAQTTANITLDLIAGAVVIMTVYDAIKSGRGLVEAGMLAADGNLKEPATALTPGVAYLGAVAANAYLLSLVTPMRNYLNSRPTTPPDQG